jgi:hypothetical protein
MYNVVKAAGGRVPTLCWTAGVRGSALVGASSGPLRGRVRDSLRDPSFGLS